MLKYFDEKLKNKVTNNNGGLTTTYHKLLKNNV